MSKALLRRLAAAESSKRLKRTLKIMVVTDRADHAGPFKAATPEEIAAYKEQGYTVIVVQYRQPAHGVSED